MSVVDKTDPKAKITQAAWLPLNRAIVAAYNSDIVLIDPEVRAWCRCGR